MHRIFINEDQIENNQIYLNSDDFHHLARVQRVKLKEKIEIVLNDKILLVEILQILKNGFLFREIKTQFMNKIGYEIILAQALPKQDKFSEVLRLCLPLHVAQIIPVVTKRTVSRLDDHNLSHKFKRWQNVIKEVAAQAKLNFLAKLDMVVDFDEFIKNTDKKEILKIVLWEEEKNVSLKQVLQLNKHYHSILLFVGPEGGFSEEEITMLKQNGFLSVSLGDSILRTEQAGFFSLAAINYEFL
ncbi:MAG: RsmE family RNA methyltransferase [Candidatus Margulisiibacteriota bacterium]|jgi:16S rRNA (uracil1498-N3)-methyltransferase